MQAHPIENIMRTTMEQITEMIDVNTIVGDAVETNDGSVIIPVSRVSFGFVSGGAEYGQGKEAETGMLSAEDTQTVQDLPFGGGAGAGVSVSPMAFLVVGNDQVKLLPVDAGSLYGQIINAVPSVISELRSAFRGDRDYQADIKLNES